jgi:hypothetical protein
VGAIKQVKSGDQTRLWEDVWLGQVPLKLSFPRLYEICNDRNSLVGDCYKQGECVIEFRRPFGPGELAQWEDMLTELGCVSIQEGNDGIHWCLEKSGQYTIRSMYRSLVHRGVLNPHMRRVWKARLPMKLKVFMWQVFQDKSQTRGTQETELERGWKLYGVWSNWNQGSHSFLMPNCQVHMILLQISFGVG